MSCGRGRRMASTATNERACPVAFARCARDDSELKGTAAVIRVSTLVSASMSRTAVVGYAMYRTVRRGVRSSTVRYSTVHSRRTLCQRTAKLHWKWNCERVYFCVDRSNHSHTPSRLSVSLRSSHRTHAPTLGAWASSPSSSPAGADLIPGCASRLPSV